MTRIAFLGAGSVEFTRNLLGDLLTFPELADATIALHDIDPDRLATAEGMARWTSSQLGAGATLLTARGRAETPFPENNFVDTTGASDIKFDISPIGSVNQIVPAEAMSLYDYFFESVFKTPWIALPRSNSRFSIWTGTSHT